MRLKALIPNHETLDIAIIHQASPTSFFLYIISADHQHGFDDWAPDLDSVKFNCKQEYHIDEDAWEQIPDVLPGALEQFEEPTVGVRDETGKLNFIPYDVALKQGIVPPKPFKVEIVDDSELIDEVLDWLIKNNPLRAMQAYMRGTGCDLMTAKQAIHQLRGGLE